MRNYSIKGSLGSYRRVRGVSGNLEHPMVTLCQDVPHIRRGNKLIPFELCPSHRVQSSGTSPGYLMLIHLVISVTTGRANLPL